MNTKLLQIENISAEEFLADIRANIRIEIDALKVELSNPQENNEELLNRKEVCELLRISEVTLWNWEKEGRIRSYKVNSRNYYKRSDIESALKPKQQQ